MRCRSVRNNDALSSYNEAPVLRNRDGKAKRDASSVPVVADLPCSSRRPLSSIEHMVQLHGCRTANTQEHRHNTRCAACPSNGLYIDRFYRDCRVVNADND